jgi:hypothetical protein
MIKYRVSFRNLFGYSRSGNHKLQTKSFNTIEERDKEVAKLQRNSRFYKIESIFESEDIEKIIPNTTCQICGRPIQSKKGLIAHHGYQRPSDGWQTPSCFGARYLPYEKSRDRIPEAIEILKGQIESNKLRIQNIKDKKVSIYRLKRYDELIGKEIKPEDPEYDKLAPLRISSFESEIKHIEFEIGYLQERYNKWVKKII